jgi:outer membrane protein assembly factor BamB
MPTPVSNRISNALFVVAVAFLLFVAGAVVTVAKLFPSDYIRDAYRGGYALYDKLTRQLDPLKSDLWALATTTERGTIVNDAGRSFAGVTLYTSGDGPTARLVSMDGRVIHQWSRKFSSIWDNTAAVRDPVPDDQTYFRKAHVFPNGDLLAIYIGVGDSPYGYGMVKLDADSNVIWKNLDHFHHDFAVADDGRIYGLTHGYRKRPLEGADQFTPPFLDDYLVVLSPDGTTTKKISLLDAVNRSDYRRYLWRIAYYSMEDPLHTNGVDLLSADDARALRRKIPAAAEGQVLLSFRELASGSVALLDPEKEEVVWAYRGPWLAQHDPDILPNGDLLVFDNRGHFGQGGKSRVIEVDPATGGIVWTYSGNDRRRLHSLIRSAQQRLPNGNTLITESDGGRLLEVTPDGDIVWEYVNPIRAGDHEQLIPVVSWGQRIDTASLTARFRASLQQRTAAMEVEK